MGWGNSRCIRSTSRLYGTMSYLATYLFSGRFVSIKNHYFCSLPLSREQQKITTNSSHLPFSSCRAHTAATMLPLLPTSSRSLTHHRLSVPSHRSLCPTAASAIPRLAGQLLDVLPLPRLGVILAPRPTVLQRWPHHSAPMDPLFVRGLLPMLLRSITTSQHLQLLDGCHQLSDLRLLPSNRR